jgi:hypothetical protein
VLILGANSITGGYEVANSVRLNDGSSDGFSLSGQNGNRKTFTFSCWVKRGVFGENFLFNSRIDASNHFLIRFTGGHQLELLNRTSASNNFILTTNRLFRDVSAWYHIVVAVDTTQSTANDRVKFYVNGVQETSFATQTMGSQNADLSLNISTATHYIGQEYTSGSNFFDGYMAECVLIDGTALDPTSFGEFDADTGIWKPIDVSGLTFGTNGFYLEFKDSSALGDDTSGNGNDFTVNNLTSIDQTTDTPTNNFCTLNPLAAGSFCDFSEGNLTLEGNDSADYANGFSTVSTSSSGKWYYEIKIDGITGTSPFLGMVVDDDPKAGIATNGGANSAGGSSFSAPSFSIVNTGQVYQGGTGGSTYTSFASEDIISFSIDMDNGACYIGKNGTYMNSGNPASGASKTGAIVTWTAGSVSGFLPSASCYEAGGAPGDFSKVSINFGNPPFTISSGNADGNGYGNFEYSVPSGYYALNTKNLAEYG